MEVGNLPMRGYNLRHDFEAVEALTLRFHGSLLGDELLVQCA